MHMYKVCMSLCERTYIHLPIKQRQNNRLFFSYMKGKTQRKKGKCHIFSFRTRNTMQQLNKRTLKTGAKDTYINVLFSFSLSLSLCSS